MQIFGKNLHWKCYSFYEHLKIETYLIYCSGFAFKENVASWQMYATKMLDIHCSSE